ncbi:hypothetical protein B0H17DRAFT_1139724 [Mycena rosella]|uniref:DUF4246 domain-containing protein n=1 Tax=Mycena rosella TaxID=1033263 RepID=A0AAD7D3V3_MYCRO|nr:hypothetical protein B0H17DRAFT_1139724 [Mycena rosella]
MIQDDPPGKSRSQLALTPFLLWTSPNRKHQGMATSSIQDQMTANVFRNYAEIGHPVPKHSWTFPSPCLDGARRIHEALRSRLRHRVSSPLRNEVMKLEDVPDDLNDWHPESNNQVLDLVHTSLDLNTADGSVKLLSSYINNLHPAKHKPLYLLIESVLTLFVLMFKQVFSQVNGHDKDLYRDITPVSARIMTEKCSGMWSGYDSKYAGIMVPCI